MRGIVATTVLATVVLCAAVARAESPAELQAKQRFAAAQKSFEHARYAEALAEYREAYALSRYPAILYKIALCQDQLGRFGEAIDAYQQYLEADADTDRRAGVEERIAKLRLQIAPAVTEKPAPEAVEPPPVPVAVTAPAAPASPPRKPLYKRWWVWTLAGAGVAAVALGVGLGVGLSQGSSPTLGTFSNAGLRF